MKVCPQYTFSVILSVFKTIEQKQVNVCEVFCVYFFFFLYIYMEKAACLFYFIILFWSFLQVTILDTTENK